MERIYNTAFITIITTIFKIKEIDFKFIVLDLVAIVDQFQIDISQ